MLLTGGRAEKSIGAQIGQGLYALYGITGYIGDLVSYTRLMALGLAGGSIAAALNLLMQSLTGFWVILIPVLFILAHVFNLLLIFIRSICSYSKTSICRIFLISSMKVEEKPSEHSKHRKIYKRLKERN